LDNVLNFRFIKDLLRVHAFEGLAVQFQAPSISKFVGISYPVCCGPSNLQPDVDVGGFMANFDFNYPQPIGNGCTFKSRHIIPIPSGQSLNSVLALEVFIQQHPVSCHQGLTGPFSRLHKAFGDFAEKCKNTPHLAFKVSVPPSDVSLQAQVSKIYRTLW
jgi:hypothetical protein